MKTEAHPAVVEESSSSPCFHRLSVSSETSAPNAVTSAALSEYAGRTVCSVSLAASCVSHLLGLTLSVDVRL